MLPKGHVGSTHRLVPPAATLERIRPSLPGFGITRCADVTGLDSIGIPVYVAIRPQGRILQTSNGKGQTRVDAQVSALMESIEHWHAENPILPRERTSLAMLRRRGVRALAPRRIEGYAAGCITHPAQVLDWVRGEDLVSGEEVSVPAFAVCLTPHQQHDFSTNGLASGNHLVEATLHALYELFERDAIARLSHRGRVRLERCDVVALESVTDEAVGDLEELVRRAGIELVLLRVPTRGPIHTFMAVLLDSSAFASASSINLGFGAHLSPSVAAIRAITEAAQARLTFIHGSRDDLNEKAYQGGHEGLLSYFSSLEPDIEWGELEDHATLDFTRDYQAVLATVRALGFAGAYRVDLSQGLAGVAVARVIIVGARFPGWI